MDNRLMWGMLIIGFLWYRSNEQKSLAETKTSPSEAPEVSIIPEEESLVGEQALPTEEQGKPVLIDRGATLIEMEDLDGFARQVAPKTDPPYPAPMGYIWLSGIEGWHLEHQSIMLAEDVYLPDRLVRERELVPQPESGDIQAWIQGLIEQG